MISVGTVNRLAHILSVQNLSAHICKYGGYNCSHNTMYPISKSLEKRWTMIEHKTILHVPQKKKSGGVQTEEQSGLVIWPPLPINFCVNFDSRQPELQCENEQASYNVSCCNSTSLGPCSLKLSWESPWTCLDTVHQPRCVKQQEHVLLE